MQKLRIYIIAVAAVLLLAHCTAQAQVPKNEEWKKAHVQRAEALVAAFGKGDAKTLAGFWTPDGTYTDQTGKRLNGRKAIQKAFQGFFAKNKGLKLLITKDTLRFVTKDVAIEEGATEVINPDGTPPSQVQYTIVHVNKDGKWYLDSVKESLYTPPTNYNHLQALEWALGDWVDASEKGEVGRMSFSWGPNQNFIVGSFATTIKNISLSSGTQWIGWDPKTKNIRSWTFDDSGSFSQGNWANNGGKWFIKTKTILRDGKTVTATNIVTQNSADSLTWQSVDRAVDGKALPDTKKIKMKRIK